MRRFASAFLVSLLVATPLHAGDAQKPAAAPDGMAGYHFLVARHLESIGKTDEAIMSLQKAIAIVPDSAELHAELAGLYARHDRALEALTAAEDALKRDPNNREANRSSGPSWRFLRTRRSPCARVMILKYAARAIAALEKARGEGTDLNLLLMLGKLQLRAGQYDKAAGSLRRIFEEQPQYTEGGMPLASAQGRGRAYRRRHYHAGGGAQFNPTHFRGFVKLIQLYEQQRLEGSGRHLRVRRRPIHVRTSSAVVPRRS